MVYISYMQVDSYAYIPPNLTHSLKCDASSTLVAFERRFVNDKA